jgi:dolichol-phosphate mannosyltransferase
MIDSNIGIILPTYREADSIANIIDEIENLNLNTSILIIDDSSPDKTAKIIQEKQKKYHNILFHLRPKKGGLGSAITDGFKIFLSSKQVPKYIVAMDADCSHDPAAIPQLLSIMHEKSCGIVIGSRYCSGGNTMGWPFTRKIISRAANLIAKISLGLNLHDFTSGFRCYSTIFLKAAIDNLHSQTYEIQIETIRQAVLRNFSIVESPISFVNRKCGKSKLSFTEIESFMAYILKTISHP